MNVTERIERLEQLDHQLSLASDRYEEAWTAQFENPSAENLGMLDAAGLAVEIATQAWLDALS